MTDSQLIEAIKAGGTSRLRAIRYIYIDWGLRSKIIQLVRSYGGNQQDGEDIYHEGLIVLDRNIRQDKFRGDSAIKSYLYSICRLLWMNQIRKNAKINLTADHQTMDQDNWESPEAVYLSDERRNLLATALSQLNERCKRILELWKLSYSMEEIARELDLSNATIAKKNRYRCHKRLIKILEEQPTFTKSLKESR